VHAGPAEGLRIRQAAEGDEAWLVAIDSATWSPRSSPGPEPGRGTSFWNERTRPENVWVAEAGGQVVGYVKIDRPTELESNQHVWLVTGLAVDPGAQRGGVGHALMDAAADAARSRGGRRLTLRVFGPNEPARRLYERMGFEVEGVLRDEFRVSENEYVDDYLMALDLRQ
jgi:ribosomal protein S18 acetylase RimI-like enzyme